MKDERNKSDFVKQWREGRYQLAAVMVAVLLSVKLLPLLHPTIGYLVVILFVAPPIVLAGFFWYVFYCATLFALLSSLMVFYYELKKSLLGRDSVPEHSINEWIDYNKTSQRVFGILIMSALLGYIYYCVIAVLANMPEILPVMDPWEVAKYSLENGYFGSPEGY